MAFALATLACASAGAVASTSPVGTSVRPTLGDGVVYLVPRQVGACRVGEIATGSIVAQRSDIVRAIRQKVAGTAKPLTELLVNGQYVTTLPSAGAQAFPRTKIPAGSVFLLGNGNTRACDSRVFGPVSISRLVGYTQRGLDARVAVVQAELNDRISAEKYVAGVYLLVVASFLAYLLIHASKVARLEKQVAALATSLSDSP